MIYTFILSCIFLPLGYLIAKKTFSKIDQNDLLNNKLRKYQSGQMIRMATCEGVGLLAIVSLLLTSNLFFLIFLFTTREIKRADKKERSQCNGSFHDD